ncbi:MAG: choice-of-anchor D domain-containing protein [bacterium]
MRNLIITFAILLIQINANSQSLSVFDLDTSNFPIIRAKFYAFNVDGKQITNLNPTDFTVTENGTIREVLNVFCPPDKIPEAISSVITLDKSGSMNGGNLVIAKAAATVWVECLPLGQSDCAITSFDGQNYFNQDFTTDLKKLLKAINNLSPNDGTDFNAGFINPPAGALIAVEAGKHKRVVIFLTDGQSDGNEDAIVQKANSIGAVIYCITLNMPCPPILKNVATRTNGEFFENVTTKEQAQEIYRRILYRVLDVLPCTIEWKSDIGCTLVVNNVEIRYLSLNQACNIQYKSPSNSIPILEFSPKYIYFKNVTSGIQRDTNLLVSAKNADFNIENIISSNPLFTITPKSFNLVSGQSQLLKVSYLPTGNDFNYSKFEIINDQCPHFLEVSGGYGAQKPKIPTLKLLHPNGGEKFVVGSDTIITWEGILPIDMVSLDLSRDNGLTWDKITDEAIGLNYKWQKISKPTSDNCLVRITTKQNNNADELIAWKKCYGGTNNDRAKSVIETRDGNYIVIGSTQSTDGDISGKNQNDSDFWIIKLNQDGKILWEKHLGGSLYDWAYSIIESNDGGYVAIGSTTSSDKDVSGHHGSSDFWIVKLKQTGEIEWQKCYGGSNWEDANSIIATGDGGYVVAGFTQSDNEDVVGNIGMKDFWILKLDQMGEIIWKKCLGGTNNDVANSIIETIDGDYAIAGYTQSNDGDVLGKQGNNPDFWVIKLNQSGDIIWQRSFGGSGDDRANSLIETSDGGYCVVGITFSTDGDIIGKNNTDGDSWIVKLSNQGKIDWQTTLGGTLEDYASSVNETMYSDFIVTGYTNSNDGDVFGNKGMKDLWVLMLDNTGHKKWQLCLGGSNEDYAESIRQTIDGCYIVTGSAWSNDIDVFDNHGTGTSPDFWVIKFNSQVSAQQDVSDSVFSIVDTKILSKNVNMGEVLLGDIKDSIISDFVFNSGSWKYSVDSIYFRGPDANAFNIISGIPKYQISSGETKLAEFRFIPNRIGNHSSEIIILTQADTLFQNISGLGINPEIQVLSDFIDFGDVEVGTNKIEKRYIIKNVGTKIIDFYDIQQLGPDEQQFDCLYGSNGFTLLPNDSIEMEFEFAPIFMGRTSGSTAFYFNGPGSPAIVNLYGKGIGGVVYIPDDSAYVGDIFDIRLMLSSIPTSSILSITDKFRAKVAFDNSIIYPLGSSINDGKRNIIDYTGEIEVGNDVLAKIPVRAALGNTDKSVLDLLEFSWIDDNNYILDYDTELHSGNFKLLGLCKEGGKRLFSSEGQVNLFNVFPNPVTDEIRIQYELIEHGRTEIKLINILGLEIESHIQESAKIGLNELTIKTSHISQGMYYLVLQTPTVKQVQIVNVIK